MANSPPIVTLPLISLTALMLAALPFSCANPSTSGKTLSIAPVIPTTRLRIVDDLDFIRLLLIRALNADNIAALLDASARSADFLAQPHKQTPRFTASSLETFQQILRSPDSPETKAHALLNNFDFYQSVGSDNQGTVQFTGYFAPEYPASKNPTDRFRFPVYQAPAEYLKALRTHGTNSPTTTDPPTFQSRQSIEKHSLLRGLEIAYLDDPLNLYLLHVNGSGLLRLPDQSTLSLGHSATNNLPYTSLGKLLIEAGYATADEMSMQKIRSIFNQNPAAVLSLMSHNDRYVFFEELPANTWPRGSLGSVLTPLRSIATDKTIFPPGGPVLITTTLPNPSSDHQEQYQPFVQLAFDQDTGGAIKGPGRADIFIGIGTTAGQIAGRLNATGQLYYLLPKTNTNQ